MIVEMASFKAVATCPRDLSEKSDIYRHSGEKHLSRQQIRSGLLHESSSPAFLDPALDF